MKHRPIHYHGANSRIDLHHTATTEIWQQQKRSRKVRFEYSIGPRATTGPNRGWLRKTSRANPRKIIINIYTGWARKLNDDDLLIAYEKYVGEKYGPFNRRGEAILAELDRRTTAKIIPPVKNWPVKRSGTKPGR